MTSLVRIVVAGLLASCLVSATSSAQTRPSSPGRGSFEARQQAGRVRVEILELRALREPDFGIRVNVSGASSDRPQQVLIFAQDQRSGSFRLAARREGKGGEPLLPKMIESGPSTTLWSSVFPMSFSTNAVFAVVCELGERAAWDKRREFGAVSYLPFGEATSIDQVLRMLSEFDWRPLGYTYVKP
jgi:hypothetical protein